MASLLDKVQVHDAGDKIVLSSEEEATLKYVMDSIEKEGGKLVQRPVRVGKMWMASFENPAIQACVVERNGYQVIISGPTAEIVIIKSHEFREKGALIAAGPRTRRANCGNCIWTTGAQRGHA